MLKQLILKNSKSAIIVAVIFISQFILGCSKDDEGSENNNGNNNSVKATCFDGIQNQNETGIDCGGVCPPCDSSTTNSISFTLNGNAAVITSFAANRNPNNNPSIVGLIAVTNSGDKLSILLQEPAVTGWGDGLSFLSLDQPNQMIYEVTDSIGNPIFYSSANGSNAEEVSFLKLEYKVGGKVKGSFSGVLEDENGNTVSIENGSFDTEFVN